MSNLINCPKCGALFVKTNRDVCDKCYQEKIVLSDNIIKYIEEIPEEEVHVKLVLEHFNIGMNEFESLLTNCKLTAIERKLVINCAKCGVLMHINSSFSTLCKQCSIKLKNEVLKRLIK